MTRRLLVALLLLLALGAVLDRTVHREAVGPETLGDERRVTAGPDGAVDRTVPTLVGTADEWDGRYSLYRAVRELAPGVTVMVDEPLWETSISETYLRALGAVDGVRPVADGGFAAPSRPADRTGTYQHGAWAIWVGREPVTALRIAAVDGRTIVVDAALLGDADQGSRGSPATADEVTTARAPDRAPSVGRAIVVEAGILIGLLLLGGLLLPRAGIDPLLRVAMALPVGVATHAAVGVLRLPGAWGVAATAAIAFLVPSVLYGRGTPSGWTRADKRRLGAASIGILAVVAWARWTTFMTLTPDSRDYWAGGAVLADGDLAPALLDVKRGLSLQALHAIGFAAGIEGLQALGAVLLAAGVVLLGASVASVSDRSRSSASVPVVLAAVALVASPQVRGFAAYINTHMMVAVLLATLVILLTLGRGTLPAIAVVAAGLVLSRAEGGLLVGLALLGTLALAERRTVRVGPWVASGIAALVWAGLLGIGAAQVGRGLPTAVVLVGLIGAALLLGGLGVLVLPTQALRRVPIVVSVPLWAVALLLMLRVEGVVYLDAARENLGGGAGAWGVLGILLVVAAVLAVGLSTGSSSAEVTVGRWVVIGFVPLTLFTKLGDGLDGDAGLASLLVGGGRAGFGDSVNRMWMHVVFVVLFVLLHGALAAGEEPRRAWAKAPGVVVAIIAAIAAGWVAGQWQPTHLPRAVSSEVVVHRTGTVESTIPTQELVDGSTIEQELLIPPFLPPQGATATEVCVDVRLVTFGNVPTGTVALGLTGGGLAAERTLRGERIADFGIEPICLALDTDGPEPLGPLDDLTLTVRAVGTSPGAAPGLLLASGVGPGADVQIPGASGSGVGAANASVVLEVRLVLEAPGSPLDRAGDTAALLLPWVAVLVGVGLLASSVRRERDAADGAHPQVG